MNEDSSGTQQAPSGPPPGWYGDPQGLPVQRWWDGTRWTEHTQPGAGAQQGGVPQGSPSPASAPQSAAQQPKTRRLHWVRNIATVIAGLVIVIIIAGLLSHTSSGGSGSSGTCTSGSCIATDIRQTLVNSVAKDDSVITKMTCDPSSVAEPSSGTYTENCTAAYSDGTTVSGTGTVDISQNEVTFTPSGE